MLCWRDTEGLSTKITWKNNNYLHFRNNGFVDVYFVQIKLADYSKTVSAQISFQQ